MVHCADDMQPNLNTCHVVELDVQRFLECLLKKIHDYIKPDSRGEKDTKRPTSVKLDDLVEAFYPDVETIRTIEHLVNFIQTKKRANSTANDDPEDYVGEEIDEVNIDQAILPIGPDYWRLSASLEERLSALGVFVSMFLVLNCPYHLLPSLHLLQ